MVECVVELEKMIERKIFKDYYFISIIILKKMVYVQKTSNEQFVITIPKSIIKLVKWKKGTELVFLQDNQGNVILKTIKPNRSKNEK